MCGINCRHSFYPYFDGMKAHYGADELDEMAGEKVRFTGSDGVEHELTRYEGEQKLRGIERKIRYYKKKALVRRSAGVDDTAARRKLGEWQAAARDFVKQTGIARDYAREYVGVERNLFNPRQAQPRGSKGTKERDTPQKLTLKSEKSLEVLEKQEKVNPEKLQRVIKGLRKSGIDVQTGEDIDAFLNYRGTEALTVQTDTGILILYHSKLSASGMFEEIIHSAQVRKYGEKKAREMYHQLEVEAKEKLLKNAKAYGITEYEKEVIQQMLDYHKSKLKEKDV